MANVKNIKKWVKALRSGKYKQDIGQLRSEKGYCCLGVACEVSIKNRVILNVSQTKDNTYLYDGDEGVLPESVSQWLGVDRDPVLTNGKRLHVSCSTLNDHRRKTFNEIADWVEATYLSV